MRDESVREKIPWSGLNYLDLWHEDLWDFEEDVPLYLVELEKDSDFTNYLLEHTHKDLATYCITPYTIEQLQHYYSFFTYPTIEKEGFERFGKKEPTPEGKEWSRQVFFGAFSVSMLDDYIDSLYTQEKIDELFMGVAMWLIPKSEENELYLAFRDKEGNVDDVNLVLEHIVEVEAPMLNFDTLSFPNQADLASYAHEISIDLKQMEFFEQRHRRKFIDDVFFWAERDGWQFYGNKDVNKKRAMTFFDEANSIGIESEESVYSYIVCGLSTAKLLKETALYDKLRVLAKESQKSTILKEQLWKILQFQRRANG